MSRLCALIWIPPHSFGLSRPTQSRCSTCWSHPHLGNSLPHLRLKQLSFFSSAAIRHDVFHQLPFDSSSPRESSGSRAPATPRVSCLARQLLRLTSRCLHGPSHAASGLAVLAVLAVEHRSPVTPSAHCVWRSLTSCHQPSSLSGCVAFLVCFRHSS